MERQSAAKLYGKKEEFLFISKRVENTLPYKKYFCTLQCKNCDTVTEILQTHLSRAICITCRSNEWAKDYVGKTIGTYNVLEFIHKKGRLNYYKCECIKCKSISKVSIQGIKNNNNCKNCRIIGKIPTIEAQVNFLKHQYKVGAKNRNLEFLLTHDEFKNIIYKNCYYCGTEPKHRNPARTKIIEGSFKVNGIDRINSNLGYTLNNCVSCCSICNEMKMSRSIDEFKYQIEKIYIYQKERSTTIPEGSTPKQVEIENNSKELMI